MQDQGIPPEARKEPVKIVGSYKVSMRDGRASYVSISDGRKACVPHGAEWDEFQARMKAEGFVPAITPLGWAVVIGVGLAVLLLFSGCVKAMTSDTQPRPTPTSTKTSVYDNDYETVQEYADRNEISFEVAECEFVLDDYYTSRGETYDPAALGRACGNPHDMP